MRRSANTGGGVAPLRAGSDGPTSDPSPRPVPLSGGGAAALFGKVRNGFASLRTAPPELHKAYVLKFLDSYSYFSFSIIFTLFLSDDFGFTDVQAGTIYGAWGALITIYGLFAGIVVDNLGVAASLRVGFALSFVSRSLIFLCTSRYALLLNVCVLLPMGNCLGIPVLTTGIRRYTTESNRGFAFGLFYVVMNLSALISGPVVDFFTVWHKRGGGGGGDGGNGDDDLSLAVEGGKVDGGGGGWSFSGYRAVVLTGVVANALACLVTMTVREIKVDSEDDPPPTAMARATDINSLNDEDDPTGPSTGAVPPPPSAALSVKSFRPEKGSACDIVRETIRTPAFWRFLAVCLVTLNVRMIFRHLDATLPKYMLREFGPDTPKGTIYSINPALIVILVPLVTSATTDVDPLVMIHGGSYVSAASVFFLVASTSVWSCAAFVTVLSVGEAVWSPRLYDYTVSVAREGREGTYMALSSAPLFLAKLPVGFMSGYLLQRYCPEDGPRESKTMWLIIGLTTAVSPILMTIFWGYISKRDGETTKYTELTSAA